MIKKKKKLIKNKKFENITFEIQNLCWYYYVKNNYILTKLFINMQK